jgi:hypothetical protein
MTGAPFDLSAAAEPVGEPVPRSGKKLVFAAIAALGAIAAVANAAVNILHERAPAMALVIDPGDPVALVRNAELESSAGYQSPQKVEDLKSTVQRAVTRLPINGPAFRLYGLSSAAKADLEAVRAQMHLSDLMERRDLGAQLWLIENAVERNDVDRALLHHDRALRIEESSRELLYPVLTDALDSPLIRERFRPFLAANPPWLASFLRFAVSTSARPVSLAKLVRENGGWPEGSAFSSLDKELLARLVHNSDFAEAAAFFGEIAGADPSILTSLRIAQTSTDQRLAPFAWQPYRLAGVESYFVDSTDDEDRLEIETEIEAGYKGLVVRKFVALEPGDYHLSAKMRAENFSRHDTARWALSCAGAEQVPLLFNKEVALGKSMVLAGNFLVPDECPLQQLRIEAETMVTTRYVKLVVERAAFARSASPEAAEKWALPAT